ncbi:MAG: Flagellin [Candidatus Solibacter sp.]|nr:Flagellin [Candidatus Solibacter sp.]
MLSIQTNVNSLMAQENLSVNTAFQAKTIQSLTSGYRINSSGDDAAGLAVANKFRSDTAELTQGVRNANDAISQLQIIDGGVNNVSHILDRLKTLATQSASGGFTGNRNTVNNEFQTLLSEIDRQAKNVKLNTGGAYNTNLMAYIGGSAGGANVDAQVSVDLSASAIDQTGLGLAALSVVGGGSGFGSTNTVRLDNSTTTFLANGHTQDFTVDYMDGAGVMHSGVTVTASGTNTATGLSGQKAVDAVNTALTGKGITNVTAQLGSDGKLAFSGNSAFQIKSGSVSAGADGIVTDDVNGKFAVNLGLTNATTTFSALTAGTGVVLPNTFSKDVVTFTVAAKSYNVTIDGDAANVNGTNVFLGNTAASAVNGFNSFFAAQGLNIRAFSETGGAGATNIKFQGSTAFTMSAAFTAGTGDTVGAGGLNLALGSGQSGAIAVTAADTDKTVTGHALAAVDAINDAVGKLGLVQGKVGAGQNQLHYGIGLATSQITNFSAAESQIRDTDVAAEAANLSKAQVLMQASMAAMAQANSAPQAVLALLRG